MIYVIGLLTVVFVVDCLILVFLVLLQLPKKEAGAGLAFGGAATDALFGAGSGNVLTKITKYSATTFFVLSVLLSVLQSRMHGQSSSEFEKRLKEAPTALPGVPAPAPKTTPPTAAGSNSPKLVVPAEDTNVPVTPAAPASAPVVTPPPATKP